MKKGALMMDVLKTSLVAALVAAAFPDLAFAQTDVAALLNTTRTTQLPAIPKILGAVCYVGGGFLMVSGALALKKHAENPASTPMAQGVSRLITGGALVSLPAVTNMIQDTFFTGTAAADYNAITPTF